MREGIRYPKFADKFNRLDFEAAIPVISLYSSPAAKSLEDLDIEVCALEDSPRTISGKKLVSLTSVHLKAPLICQIFNWSEEVELEGVRLSDFLDAFQIETHPEGYYAVYSRDGSYFEALARDEARDPRVLLAYSMNRAPLPEAHGGPLRLVVPFLQGYKSVKWVGAVRAFRNHPMGIKRLLGQSPTGQLNREWIERYQMALPAGNAADPPAAAPDPAVSAASSAITATGPIEATCPTAEDFLHRDHSAPEPLNFGLKEIIAIVRPNKREATRDALEEAGVISYTTFRVLGRGRQRGLKFPSAGGQEAAVRFLPKQWFSILVDESQTEAAVEAIMKVNRTREGQFGDGKIFVLDVEEAVRISTDERGPQAI